MADVKWIKLMTNMFDNKKIKKIRRLPEGNNIILTWIYILTKAGECNKHGGLFLTDTIPYSEQDISDDLDFPIDVIRIAIITLERFSMLEMFEDILYIKNWGEYQNIEGLDKIKEQTRLRVAKFRGIKKLSDANIESNATCNVTVTEGNATELELELELDKEKDIKNIVDKPQIPPLIENVRTYCKERSNSIDVDKWYDFYCSKGWLIGKNKMKDWKAAVRTWERSEIKQEKKSLWDGIN